MNDTAKTIASQNTSLTACGTLKQLADVTLVSQATVLDAAGGRRTSRQHNTHRTESRNVVYPWHPWCGRAVTVYEVLTRGGQARVKALRNVKISDFVRVTDTGLPSHFGTYPSAAPGILPSGPVMREHGRGKRWLLLRRWKTVRGSKRAELQALFAANRRLFKAYMLREQLDRLWSYKTRPGVLNFLMGWFKALRWQPLPEMERLGDFLLKHIEGIAAYCDHAVRFGVVESINTTIKAVLRRARGMHDEETLLLKLKWATAHPIRSARDLARFLIVQPLYSNR